MTSLQISCFVFNNIVDMPSLPLLDLGHIRLIILIVVSSLIGLKVNLCMVWFLKESV